MPDSFVKRYPRDHPAAGQIVTRTARCTCGALFTQTELNSAGLSGFTPGALENYLKACAVTSSGAIYQPRSCVRCERLLTAKT